MTAINLALDCIKGRHSSGQMLNLFKYFFGKKESVVNWDPISISIFLTYKCNLRCDMCLTHSTKFKNPFGQKPCNDVDFGLFKQILDRYKNALSLSLFGNGEPLLNEDYFKMIEYASKIMKMDVFSGSNGILIGEYINEIIEAPLKKFNVSLNGYNSNEYNRMTGNDPKLFDIVSNNIANLVKLKKTKCSKIKITASFILDQMNYKQLIDMIYFGDSLGLDEIIFFQFLPVPEIGFMAEERCLFLDNQSVLDVFNKVSSLPAKVRRKVHLPPLLDRAGGNNKYCTVWFYNLSVDGNENVGGCCCQLLDLCPSGKFSDKNVWNNKYFQEMRKRFIEPGFPLLEPCTWCYNNSTRKRGWL